MEQRLSLITLGVSDVPAARRFYEALGWVAVKFDSAEVCFFRMGGVALGLYGRQALADDAGVLNTAPGFSAVTIAYNTRSEDEVDAVLKHAAGVGARITKPAAKVFWGGYSGYFSDPDGHLWEVSYNPFWTIEPDGAVTIPDS